MSIARRLLEYVATKLPPPRVIRGDDGTPYLSKYLLLGRFRDRAGVKLHLHRFHRGDADRELHNHPWKWALSLILAGGYRETYLDLIEVAGRTSRRVRHREVRPGDLNAIRPDTFHRVELLDGECWTLFLTGDVVQSWGFLTVATGAFQPWREFYRARQQAIEEPWLKPTEAGRG